MKIHVNSKYYKQYAIAANKIQYTVKSFERWYRLLGRANIAPLQTFFGIEELTTKLRYLFSQTKLN